MSSAQQVLQTLVVRMTLNATNYTSGMISALDLQDTLVSQLHATGAAMTRWVTMPLAVIGGTAVYEFARFDKAITQSLSVMEGVGPALRKELEDQAKLLSTETATAADTLAQSYYYLAQTGLSAEASLKALSIVNNFALAGLFDQAKATDLLTDAQTSLGLTIKQNAEENAAMMTYLSDRIVKAATISNASVEQFSNALTTKSAAAMRLYGVSVEEGLAVLAAYSDQGQKGQNAGNLYDRALRLLTKSALENAKAHKALGFSVYDANGNMRAMADILDNLDVIMKGMTAEQRAATLAMLGFEARSQQAITPLLGMSSAIREYEKDIRSAAGYTQSVAIAAQQNFTDQLAIFWNTVKLAAMEIGQRLVPAINFFTSMITAGLAIWNAFPDSLKTAVVYVGLLAAAIGPILGIFTSLAIAIYAVSAALAAHVIALDAAIIRENLMKVALASLAAFLITVVIVGFVAWTRHIAGVDQALQDLERTQNKWKDRHSSAMAQQLQGLRQVQDEKEREAAIAEAVAAKKKELLFAESQMNKAEAENRKKMNEEVALYNLAGQHEQLSQWAAEAIYGAKTPEQMNAEEARTNFERMKGELQMLEDLKKENEQKALDGAGNVGPNALDQMKALGIDTGDQTGGVLVDALDGYIDSLGKMSPLWKDIGRGIKDTGKTVAGNIKSGMTLFGNMQEWLESQVKSSTESSEKRAKLLEEEAKRKQEEMARQREEFNRQIEEAQKGDSVGLRSGFGQVFDLFNRTRGAAAGGYSVTTPKSQITDAQKQQNEFENKKTFEAMAGALFKIVDNTKLLRPAGVIELLLNGG